MSALGAAETGRDLTWCGWLPEAWMLYALLPEWEENAITPSTDTGIFHYNRILVCAAFVWESSLTLTEKQDPEKQRQRLHCEAIHSDEHAVRHSRFMKGSFV